MDELFRESGVEVKKDAEYVETAFEQSQYSLEEMDNLDVQNQEAPKQLSVTFDGNITSDDGVVFEGTGIRARLLIGDEDGVTVVVFDPR